MTDQMKAEVHCEQRCSVPEGVALTEVPEPRHAWSDVVRCPNDGCGRCFFVSQSPAPTTPTDAAGGGREGL